MQVWEWGGGTVNMTWAPPSPSPKTCTNVHFVVSFSTSFAFFNRKWKIYSSLKLHLLVRTETTYYIVKHSIKAIELAFESWTCFIFRGLAFKLIYALNSQSMMHLLMNWYQRPPTRIGISPDQSGGTMLLVVLPPTEGSLLCGQQFFQMVVCPGWDTVAKPTNPGSRFMLLASENN